MKYRKGDDWYPFWIDKWLLGSTRDELIIRDAAGKFIEDLRGIFVDLMTMAYKDDGFIRANENQPYSIRRLAGSLDVPQEKLEKTIAICLEKKKLELRPDGTFYLTNREKYELSERTKQRKDREIRDLNQFPLRDMAGDGAKEADKSAKVAEGSASLSSPLDYSSYPKRKGERGGRSEIKVVEFIDRKQELGRIFKRRAQPIAGRILDYVAELTFEFPDIDWREEIEKKIASLQDHPFKKGANIALQFRNWFSNARRFAAERRGQNRVGSQAEFKTHAEIKIKAEAMVREKFKNEIAARRLPNGMLPTDLLLKISREEQAIQKKLYGGARK
jgi:hypothetical protein